MSTIRSMPSRTKPTLAMVAGGRDEKARERHAAVLRAFITAHPPQGSRSSWRDRHDDAEREYEDALLRAPRHFPRVDLREARALGVARR